MNRGFTLIELLVVIAVITILSALVLPNYGGGSKALALQRSASKLAQDLRRVQEMAMSAKEVSGIVPSGFGIYFQILSPSSYILFADIDGSRSRNGGDVDLETVALESQIRISGLAPADNFSVVFTPPDPTVWINGASSGVNAQITLGIVNDAINAQIISVNNVGLIYVGKDTAPPAPPACVDNGASCAFGSQCCSGNCYADADADADGDGYPAVSGDKTCKASASLGADCYDLNANARPGQTNYYTTNRGDGSFDYDCDGVETKYPRYDCVTTMAKIACTTNGAAFTGLHPGWVSSNPACGAVAQYRICVGYNWVNCGGGGSGNNSCSQTGCYSSPVGYYGTIDHWDTQKCR